MILLKKITSKPGLATHKSAKVVTCVSDVINTKYLDSSHSACLLRRFVTLDLIAFGYTAILPKHNIYLFPFIHIQEWDLWPLTIGTIEPCQPYTTSLKRWKNCRNLAGFCWLSKDPLSNPMIGFSMPHLVVWTQKVRQDVLSKVDNIDHWSVL